MGLAEPLLPLVLSLLLPLPPLLSPLELPLLPSLLPLLELPVPLLPASARLLHGVHARMPMHGARCCSSSSARTARRAPACTTPTGSMLPPRLPRTQQRAAPPQRATCDQIGLLTQALTWMNIKKVAHDQ